MTSSRSEHECADSSSQQLCDKLWAGVIDSSVLKKVISSVLSNDVFSSVDKTFNLGLFAVESNKIMEVDYIEAPLSYNDFFKKYLINNEPCLLGSWVSENWPSCQSWTKKLDETFVPDFDLLLESCCTAIVPVANCKSREFNSQEKSDWKFGDFIEYFNKYSGNNHPTTEPCLYLKDWHYFRNFPNHVVYTIPLYFSSDWLFELWSHSLPPFDDDYRFVYIGPKQSWTPFHADVFRSYSWSANVCGKKKWLLFPPGSEESLRDQNGRLPYDVTTSSYYTSLPHLEVTQEAGQVLFVPSGWYHQVQNLEDTISINHNWINGCTINRVWEFLQAELSDVEREISDCRESMAGSEWTSHCQLIMLSNTGIDYGNFFQILNNISSRRIATIMKEIVVTQSDTYDKLRNKTTLQGSHDLMTQQCAVVLSQLKSVCHRSSTKGLNENLRSIFEPLSDLCFIIPVLLGMTDTFHKMTMTLQASDCLNLLCEIRSCLNDVILCFETLSG